MLLGKIVQSCPRIQYGKIVVHTCYNVVQGVAFCSIQSLTKQLFGALMIALIALGNALAVLLMSRYYLLG